MNTIALSRAASLGASLRGLLARASKALSRRHAERCAAARLYSMTDRELADIGLHRGQIDAMVRGTWRT